MPHSDSGEIELRRLRWRCRRGMRELDMLLLAFVENEYAVADSPDQKAFRQLLTLPDPEILALLTGKSTVDDSRLQNIVERLLAN